MPQKDPTEEHHTTREGPIGIANKAITEVTVTPIRITKVSKKVDKRIDDVSMVAVKVNQMPLPPGEETTDPEGEGDQATTNKSKNI